MHATPLILLLALLAHEPVQWTMSCQGTSPRLERLAKAVEGGDVDVVRAELDDGFNPNEPWRDLPGPRWCGHCSRSD
jgi:hypothetical protein